MLKEKLDNKIISIPRNIPLAWTIDQSFPSEWVYLNRVFRLAHSPTPEKYACATLNYLNFSTLTSDFPLSPLFQFDPRDYHRFRFKTENRLLEQFADFFKAYSMATVSSCEIPASNSHQEAKENSPLIFVNNIEHANNILWPDCIKSHCSFPYIQTSTSDTQKTQELRTRLVHEGEVPNLSKLFKFWTQHEHFSTTLDRFQIDVNVLRRFPLHTYHKIKSISSLLQHRIFLKFLSLGNAKTNYLSIFTASVFNMLQGLKNKKNLNDTDKDSLAIILSHCDKAYRSYKDPLEFIRCIQLIFEEIKLLLSDNPYRLKDLLEHFERIVPYGKFYYANSGSNALSVILKALSLQKNEKLNIVSVGCKYYEESIVLKNSDHKLLFLDEEISSIDVLRIDLKSPANCQKKYDNQNIYTILDIIKKRALNSPCFSLVIDGTLNSLSDTVVEKLCKYFKNTFPMGNFVYFGSGVKSHCLGIDVATFGWISANNSDENYSVFNHYLQRQSQTNATDNPDFQYVTHLIRCCSTQLNLYHQQLLENTRHIHSAIKQSVDTVYYEGNEVPYIEIFTNKPVQTLLPQLNKTLLRYRGSFGFPYPTWLNITNNTDRSSIRISCGILTEELNCSLVDLLVSTFEERPIARL